VLTHLGSIAGLSVVLGAATCRLAGLGLASTEHAVREELQSLRLDTNLVEKNLILARIGYEQVVILPEEDLRDAATPVSSLPSPQIVAPAWEPFGSAPSVVASAKTPPRKTGNWRVAPGDRPRGLQPVLGVLVSCPEGAIALDADDNPPSIMMSARASYLRRGVSDAYHYENPGGRGMTRQMLTGNVAAAWGRGWPR
jgi:hypothetical protein